MPRALLQFWGGGQFLMSEVPLYLVLGLFLVRNDLIHERPDICPYGIAYRGACGFFVFMTQSKVVAQ